MTVEKNIITLVSQFGEHLISKADQLGCFHRQGVQIEGWLKGEILYFLESQLGSGLLAGFDREVRVPLRNKQKRVDIRLDVTDGASASIVWVELKHRTLEQKGTTYNPEFYFGDASSVGIRPDVEALTQLEATYRYVLILMTANPREANWRAGVDKFNSKFEPLALTDLISPERYPDYFHLGLLRV